MNATIIILIIVIFLLVLSTVCFATLNYKSEERASEYEEQYERAKLALNREGLNFQ